MTGATELSVIAAAMVLSMKAFLVIAKNSIIRGGENSEARRRAAVSRQTHWDVLRFFYRAFVLRRDEEPIP